ncbi:MAG TPA: cbb3-type cytochrome c oxidase subunit 3 [Candidatus Thiothrix moscowensis]|uniref:cbb3-type cytochrome oxidase subunit 3 n=1 Tax=unclassified Thiothrix TaxID=2636184 RepID=UPI001A2BD041|nr:MULTISPECIES: cbb3-type cytochrome c oxidase subunit 3 [unclassified Thiothrix]MBJ6612104.1 cbb3-type cytochrome c oxidase subunit 3 [Candidatus Thiothrix moscowensis]HRJ52952.1 cbb3-type cytochrome c oxidase subunit 3 [Candidatus Thiothrix moscowensis]HRJ93004.1 cbb3-type cytochrome c oxidase subunit 3 [Candidatus Thiothrix moscowensis]
MLADFWTWILDLGNSKTVALLIFFTTFVGIVIYVYSSRKRSERLESYRYMPLMDEDDADRRVKAAEAAQAKGEK